MNSYLITAQAMIGSQRVAKVVTAASAADALRHVGPELHDASYYVIAIKAV